MSHVPPVHKVLMLVENRPAPADACVWPEACALRDYGLQGKYHLSQEHLLVAYGTLLASAQSRHARAASAQVHQEDRSVA